MDEKGVIDTEFFRPEQLMLAAVVAGIMQMVKSAIPTWLRPVVPFMVGILLAAPLTIILCSQVPPWPILLANMAWRGVVGAVLAMAGFDVIKKSFFDGVAEVVAKHASQGPGGR